MRVRFLIDPDGKRIPETVALRNRYGAGGAAFSGSLLAGLIERVGYVLCDYNGDHLTVTLNAASVSEIAATALLYVLADHRTAPGNLILLREGDKLVRTFRSGTDALGYIIELHRQIPRGRHCRFDRHKVDLVSIGCQEEFRALLDAGTQLPRLRPLLQNVFNDRYLILAERRDTGFLMLEEVSDGFSPLGASWRTVGRPFGLFEDAAYGLFVAHAYKEAAQSRVPTIESVSAVIVYPGQEKVVTQYNRLIMPVRDGKRELFLSTSLHSRRTVLAA